MKKNLTIGFILLSVLLASCSQKTGAYRGQHRDQRGNTCLGGCN